jgi:hypothetical protein
LLLPAFQATTCAATIARIAASASGKRSCAEDTEGVAIESASKLGSAKSLTDLPSQDRQRRHQSNPQSHAENLRREPGEKSAAQDEAYAQSARDHAMGVAF